MDGTPTVNTTVCVPKPEDIEDHHLEWLEKRIADIESGAPLDTCRGQLGRYAGAVLKTGSGEVAQVSSNPNPSAKESLSPRPDSVSCRNSPRVGLRGKSPR